MSVSKQLPTYPSHNPTLTPTCYQLTVVEPGEGYSNFRSITRTADYPNRPIIAYGEKKSQRITRTGG